MKFKSIISVLFGISLVNAKLVMIIRHGEKLNDEVTNLSPKGEARAKCLINLFGQNGIYATPQRIYAQSPTEKKQSTRPRDTVVPLAESLGLQVDLTYTSGKVKQLSSEILNSPEEVMFFDEIWMISDGTPYSNQQTYDNVNNNSSFGTNSGVNSGTNGEFGTNNNNNNNNNINNNNNYGTTGEFGTNNNNYGTNGGNNDGYYNNNNNNNNYGNSNNNGYTSYNTNNDGSNNNGNYNNGYNYDSNVNTNNNNYNTGYNFSKRNAFSLDIVKQNIDDCIAKELSSSPSNTNTQNNGNIQASSGSV
ncbi:hypothetical protein BCR32DRAFT_331058 [Anaeromyces robustus]|uniref:Phosphoglycerate mutase-like protein n=1 Tax=Anaeromyces robustus TaxID=1754192 RepID=A0A1Y1UJ84_9FUNG|nr:hypothetical protein BCR32DRAFT_331058 [Anaeromyces robustus]|eukprot:ORX38120.1 hypothetical protein BCR32DRAFT_331058 [Anaeromyces robustus]